MVVLGKVGGRGTGESGLWRSICCSCVQSFELHGNVLLCILYVRVYVYVGMYEQRERKRGQIKSERRRESERDSLSQILRQRAQRESEKARESERVGKGHIHIQTIPPMHTSRYLPRNR